MDAGMWLVSAFFKIEYWNSQDKLLLWFYEKSQKLYIVFFSIFPLVPHWKPWKKSCLNKLKFWEASRNHKRSLSWKFQYSILKNAETSHIPASISENPVPLFATYVQTESLWQYFPFHLGESNLKRIKSFVSQDSIVLQVGSFCSATRGSNLRYKALLKE